MSGMSSETWTEEERRNVRVVRAFAEAMGKMPAEERYRTFIAPNGIARAEADPNTEVQLDRIQYHFGVDAMVAMAKRYADSKVLYETEVHEVYASGPMVVVKRTDARIDDVDPGKAYDALGVFILREGMIVEWNDYYGDSNHTVRYTNK